MLVYQRVDSIDHHRSIAEPVFLGGASKNVVKLPTTITDIKILLSLVPPITTLFGKKKDSMVKDLERTVIPGR
jgi:type IV secretory pathway TrbD component